MVGRIELPREPLPVLLRQVLADVPLFVDLAALDQGVLSPNTFYRRPQGLGAVEHQQGGRRGVQPAATEVFQQRRADGRVLRGPLPYSQQPLRAVLGNPHGRDHRLARIRGSVDVDYREPNTIETPLGQLPHHLGRCLHKRPADAGFLHPKALPRHIHYVFVVPARNTPHQSPEHRLRHGLRRLQAGVVLQFRLPAALRVAHAGPLDRQLLPRDHHHAPLTAVTRDLPFRHPLVPKPATLVHLIVQQQPGNFQPHLGSEVRQRVLKHRHRFRRVQH